MEEFPQNTPTESEKNNIEKPQVKEGVDFVFEQHPELATIGSKEQYSEYLDTIFPESKLKDIVYHGTKSESIEKFRPSYGSFGTGIYFQTNQGKYFTGTFGDNVVSVVLNTKRPYSFYSNFKGVKGDLPKLWIDLREQHQKSRTLEDLADHFNIEIKKLGYDSLTIQMSDGSVTKEDFYHLVFDSEQIHILGSDQDVKGFKKFVEHNQGPDASN